MASELTIAQELFERAEFDAAFPLLSRIASDESQPRDERSLAYAMMGASVSVWPSLYPDDQTGLTFIKKAIELDPSNDYAWWCVLESFGEHYPYHQDVVLFRRGFEWLAHRPLKPYEVTRLEELRVRHARYLTTRN